MNEFPTCLYSQMHSCVQTLFGKSGQQNKLKLQLPHTKLKCLPSGLMCAIKAESTHPGLDSVQHLIKS